jgi:hypothetical protein
VSTTGACLHRRSWSRTRPCSLSASRAAADTDLRDSGGRIRTCPSRLTVARLTDSTTPEQRRRQQGSNLRATGAACALATRCLTTRPCLRERKEGESNPQGREAHPFSRRGTAPVAVLPKVAPAGFEPATSRSRIGSSAVLSYGAECGRQESNLRRVALQATAPPN